MPLAATVPSVAGGARRRAARGRVLLVALGGSALLAGLDAALVRLGVWAPVASSRLGDVHGQVMVLGFLATLISLERAQSLGRAWAYLAPGLYGVGALALVSPAPAAVGQSRNPTLEWMTVTQGETYVVEIATDNAFANIVETSPATTGTSYVVQNPLNFGTEYFWRVVSTNICGAGTASATGSFTTRPAVGVCTGEDSARREFFDNVDNGNIGWAIAPASGNNWRISTANPSSAPNSWLGPDFTVTADTTLASPIISIPADSQFSALRFQHSVNMEENGANACWDGGFVEISTDNGGSWAPLDPVTPLEGSYFGPIPGGQQAYCGTVPYSTASMDLAGFAGQDVRVRFRVITDSNTGDFPLGWDVDDIQVISCGLNKDGFE